MHMLKMVLSFPRYAMFETYARLDRCPAQDGLGALTAAVGGAVRPTTCPHGARYNFRPTVSAPQQELISNGHALDDHRLSAPAALANTQGDPNSAIRTVLIPVDDASPLNREDQVSKLYIICYAIYYILVLHT